MRGGKLIIDLKNIDHTIGVAVNHPGIYDLIESTRKPVRLCNLVIAGAEARDIDLDTLHASGSVFEAILPLATQYRITITDTNNVTITTVE